MGFFHHGVGVPDDPCQGKKLNIFLNKKVNSFETDVFRQGFWQKSDIIWRILPISLKIMDLNFF
jgi:hypothetical protein